MLLFLSSPGCDIAFALVHFLRSRHFCASTHAPRRRFWIDEPRASNSVRQLSFIFSSTPSAHDSSSFSDCFTMKTAYYGSYPPTYNRGNRKGSPDKEQDTKEVANFLLSLKHRSVTPEPHSDDSEPHRSSQVVKAPFGSYSFGNYGYETSMPYMEQSSMSGYMPDDSMTTTSDMPWETLLADSKLVQMKDRDLVPDALFVSMAQMKPCRLSQADRVGCYKAREIGFVGMCCKHCGGQPGFGRYYPNSVRSLAQTTTSQTILKHIGSKCRFCPPQIRNALLELQRQQAHREGLATGRPRYGSRKIFFQRVWSRLHTGKISKQLEDDIKSEDEVSAGTNPTDTDETSMGSYHADDHHHHTLVTTSSKRKNRFGSLPTQKSKRAKTEIAHKYFVV